MKKKRKICFLVLMALLLSGWKKKPPETIRVVTCIDVSCYRAYGTTRRVYTDGEKMEEILNHLRQRKNLGPAQTDPERLLGDAYRIDICLSDGSHHVYYQRGNRYFSRRCHTWQETEPEQAAMLDELLRRIPGDTVKPSAPVHVLS